MQKVNEITSTKLECAFLSHWPQKTITPWNLTNNLKQKSFTNLSHSSKEGSHLLSELKVVENGKQEEQEQVKNNNKDNRQKLQTLRSNKVGKE